MQEISAEIDMRPIATVRYKYKIQVFLKACNVASGLQNHD